MSISVSLNFENFPRIQVDRIMKPMTDPLGKKPGQTVLAPHVTLRMTDGVRTIQRDLTISDTENLVKALKTAMEFNS